MMRCGQDVLRIDFVELWRLFLLFVWKCVQCTLLFSLLANSVEENDYDIVEKPCSLKRLLAETALTPETQPATSSQQESVDRKKTSKHHQEPEMPKSTSSLVKKKVPFRTIRKRAARVTGRSGTFSRKYHKPRRSHEDTATASLNSDCDTSEDNEHENLAGTIPTQDCSSEVKGKSPRNNNKTQLCDWDCRPGTPGYLSADHVAALSQLSKLLFDDDNHRLRHCKVHEYEDQSRMLLRFLRAYDFNVAQAEAGIRRHADFWHDYGMDDMDPTLDLYRDVDSSDGLYFSCGRDVSNHPVMVARPSRHHAKCLADTERAVRRTVLSMAKCCETELSPDSDGIVILYDCAGVKPANCDLAFARGLVSVMEPHFPERVIVLVVINNSWAVQGLWALISPLIHPDTKKKIVMCGHDYSTARKWVGDSHPYLMRCEETCTNKKRRRHSQS